MPADEESIYRTTEYLTATGGTWHAEDSPWKAARVVEMIRKHDLRPSRVVEVGCGSGVALRDISHDASMADTHFTGYDISEHAFSIAEQWAGPNLQFKHGNPLPEGGGDFDLLIALDVLEHVRDYMGFLELCRAKAEYKIYHIPLDVHVSSVVRNTLVGSRYTIGHLHYFVADSALATLADTGHEILDYVYTDGAIALFRQNPSLKRAIANAPRWLVSRFSVALAARWFGGYSLLVLAR